MSVMKVNLKLNVECGNEMRHLVCLCIVLNRKRYFVCHYLNQVECTEKQFFLLLNKKQFNVMQSVGR